MSRPQLKEGSEVSQRLAEKKVGNLKPANRARRIHFVFFENPLLFFFVSASLCAVPLCPLW